MLFRNRYNNYRAFDPYLSSIHEKAATDIHKYYSITLPQWTLRFVNGYFFVALGYATCTHKVRVKGRQVNDTSALLSGTDDSRA